MNLESRGKELSILKKTESFPIGLGQKDTYNKTE